MSETCTHYRYNENGDCVGMCGQPATTLYTRANEAKGPSEPKEIIYYRCSMHDTPLIQREAKQQGYTVQHA